MNILVVNVNWLGDVVLATPVFKALRERYPEARIAGLAVPGVREVLECCPFIDETIVYDEKGADRSLWRKFQLVRRLRGKRFDVAFLLHRSFSRALLVFLAGVPVRVGYDTKRRGMFLTHKTPAVPAGIHRADQYVRVVESWGVAIADRQSVLIVDRGSREEVTRMLAAAGIPESTPFIVINAGANWDLKRWPAANFAALIKRIDAELGIRCVIPGAAQDVQLARTIARESGASPVILAGETNMKQLLALLERAAVVVTADSGPMHVASSVGADLVAIFGPTRPEITGPRGKGRCVILQEDVGCNREPCYSLRCPDNVCMQAVTVDEVFARVKEIYSTRENPRELKTVSH